MERCPFCGGQLISCSCSYACLGYVYNWDEPQCGLPEKIYNEGLSDEEQSKWDAVLIEKGLIPNIVYPNICAKCGELWPELFMDNDWKKYIELNMQDKVICRECYDFIKNAIDEGRKKEAG